MGISKKVGTAMKSASWIRKMFEEGSRLKAKFGNDQVFDLSLGNPVVEPPAAFNETLSQLVKDDASGTHRYMANPGFDETRQAVAEKINRQCTLELSKDNVLMTVGAAGALNVVFKSILDPGDEVIVLAPYFAEYTFYIDNHQGKMVPVKTTSEFKPDIDAIAAAITPSTRAVLINTPNNPTGVVYTQDDLAGLATVLNESSRRSGRQIYLISDEPYRAITYGVDVPSVYDHYDNSIVVTSHSKDLALPGERIGYIAFSPKVKDPQALFSALAFCNRTLGFVNAPALMQRVVAKLQDVTVDVEDYRQKRDFLVKELKDAGYDLVIPDGAFYLFPKSPIEDDIEFIQKLLAERVLVVPGSGFGTPGYFRIAYCIPMEVIKGAIPALKKVMSEYNGGSTKTA